MKNGAVEITEPRRWDETWSQSKTCSELLPLDQDAEELVQLSTGISKDADPTSSGPSSSV